MRHTIINCDQGTPEWFAARLGRATGSKADAIMAKGRGGSDSVQRDNYIYELAEQRITGIVQPVGFVSDAMKWGTEHEPFARIAYEGETGESVVQTGFIRCDDIMAGCSLDGHSEYAGKIVGIQEIKCPMLKTHIGYLRGGVLPAEYRWQVTHNVMATGADWCDFISYRPGFKLFVARCHAKDLPIAEYSAALESFLADVDSRHAEILRYAE